MIDCLFVCLVVCLFVCLVGWLVGGFVCLFVWLVGWVLGWVLLLLSSCQVYLLFADFFDRLRQLRAYVVLSVAVLLGGLLGVGVWFGLALVFVRGFGGGVWFGLVWSGWLLFLFWLFGCLVCMFVCLYVCMYVCLFVC